MFADQKIPYLSGNRPRMAYGKRIKIAKSEKRMAKTSLSDDKDKNIPISRGEKHSSLEEYTVFLIITAAITLVILWYFGI